MMEASTSNRCQLHVNRRTGGDSLEGHGMLTTHPRVFDSGCRCPNTNRGGNDESDAFEYRYRTPQYEPVRIRQDPNLLIITA